MGKNVLVILSLICQFSFQIQISWSQVMHLRGKVFDCKGGVISKSTIILKSKNPDKIVYQTLSDTSGSFDISTGLFDGVLYELNFGHTGYREKNILIKMDTLSEHELHVCIENEYKSLEEIIVKKKIPFVENHDTLIFNASYYKKIETNRLSDLLENIPGFSVANGIISFNGQQVEKLLIEGDDLSSKNYQMLSKNLSAMIIDKVKVISDYSEDHIMGKIKKSGKVAINIELSSDAKNKINKNIGVGMANLKRYHTEMNAVQTRTKFKWFSNFGINSVAMEQDDLNELNSDESKISRYESRNEKNYLSSLTIPVPSLPVEYLKNNKDFSGGIFVAGNVKPKWRYSGQIKYYDFQHKQALAEKFTYNIADIIFWEGIKERNSYSNNGKIESAFQLNYIGDKSHLKVDIDLGKKIQKERSDDIIMGNQNDQFSDTITNGVLDFQVYLEYSKAISKRNGFRGKVFFSKSNLSEKLFSNSILYAQLGNMIYSNSCWSQFIGRGIKYVVSDIAYFGKVKKTFYEFGLRFDSHTIGFFSENQGVPGFQKNLAKTLFEVSYLPFFQIEKRLRKNDFYSIEGTAGVVLRKWDYNYMSNFNYSFSYQYVKKMNGFLSLRYKMNVSRKFADQYFIFPDSLLVGSGVLLNSVKNYSPTNTAFLSLGLNGLDISKQRSWNFITFFGNHAGEFKNATRQFQEVIIREYFQANSFNYGSNGNFENFFPFIKVKSVLGFSVINSHSQTIVNDIKGTSKIFDRQYSISFLTGFDIPVNVEIKQIYQLSTVKWNDNFLGKNKQREMYMRVKVNILKNMFLSVSYLQKFCPGLNTFHGWDLYAVLSVGPKMKFSIKGHNLSGVRYYSTTSNGNFGFSVSDYTLVGRYILFSLDWLL